MKKASRKERIMQIIGNFSSDFNDEKTVQNFILIGVKYKKYKEHMNSADVFPSVHNKHLEYLNKADEAFEELKRLIEELRSEKFPIIGKRKAKKDYYGEYCSFVYKSVDITAIITL